MIKRTTFAITDVGMKRKINQDAFLKDDGLGLYVVADGMGGHRGGEVASKLAVEVIQTYCQQQTHLSGRDQLDKGINLSCQEIFKQSKAHEELNGMGTTVVAMLFQNDVIYIAQVGDSRSYLTNDFGIWQITEDHSLLNEEIRAGRLAPADVASYQFKNVITRSVGYENHVNVDIYRRKVKKGDTFICCTDGLSGLVAIHEIRELIQKKGLEEGLRSLVGLANERGGDDNITVLGCRCE